MIEPRTGTEPAGSTVTTVQELERIIGLPVPRTRDKVRPGLDEADRGFLAAARLCFVATSDADGRCDASPKGDPAGTLVHVLDDRTLAIAERPGNRRVDGYRNILVNPHVGLVFVVPGRSDTLRVNGRARLVSAAPWFDALAVQGRRPVLALVVEVEEVFGHCAKSLVRAQAWHPETWRPADAADVSATARALRAEGRAVPLTGTVEQIEARQIDSYGGREALY